MSKLSMLVCTWNVGNAEPPVDLSAWLGGSGNREYDIIVVGAQEANFSVDAPRADGDAEPPATSWAQTPVSTTSAAAAAAARAPKYGGVASSPTTPPQRSPAATPGTPRKGGGGGRPAGLFNAPIAAAWPANGDAALPVSPAGAPDLFAPSSSVAAAESPLTPSRRGVAAAAAAAAAVSGAVSGAASAAAVVAGRGASSVIGGGAGKAQPLPPSPAPPPARPEPTPPPALVPAPAEAMVGTAGAGVAPEKVRFSRRILRVLTTGNLRHRSSVPGALHGAAGTKMRSSKSLGAGVGTRRHNRLASIRAASAAAGAAGGGSGLAGSGGPASPASPAVSVGGEMRHGSSLMEIGAARYSRTRLGVASPDSSLSASSGRAPPPIGRSAPTAAEAARGAAGATPNAMVHHSSVEHVARLAGGGLAGAGRTSWNGGPILTPAPPPRGSAGPRARSAVRSPSLASSRPAPGVIISSSSEEDVLVRGVVADAKVVPRGRLPAVSSPARPGAFRNTVALPVRQGGERLSSHEGASPSGLGARRSAHAFPRAHSAGALNMRLSELDALDSDDDDAAFASPQPAARPAPGRVDKHDTYEGDDSSGASGSADAEENDGDEDDFGAETGIDDDEDDRALGELQCKELSLDDPTESDEDDTFDLYNVDNRRSLVVDESAASIVRQKVGKKRSKRRRVLRKTSDDALGNRFNSRVAACVGDEYVAVARQHLMEIKLQVFVHRRIKDRVLKTKTVTEATGIGHVVGNKGAVAVKLTVDDTTLCFVSSHLAAHEGAKFLRERNAQAQEILRSIERAVPALHSFDHVFWMGDLNYRLDLTRVVPEAADWPHARKWKWVRRRIAMGDYEDLLKADELIGEMQSNNCVFGRFVEGPLEFLPTFKVHRDREDTLTSAVAEASSPGASAEDVSAASAAVMAMYQKERVPSFCDRVLWHSLPVHRKHAVLLEYNAVPSIITSDHKPVYAVFELTVPRPLTKYPLPPPLSSIKCTIDVRRLRLTGAYTFSRAAGGGGYAAELGAGFDPAVATQQNEFLDDMVRTTAHGNPIDEITKVGRGGGGDSGFSIAAIGAASDIHSRRAVKVEFLGPSLLLKGRSYSSVVPQRDNKRDGKVRECVASELPCLPCVPVLSLAELQFKYLTMVFSRSGSKVYSSCVLPMSLLIHAPGHKLATNLELLKYGRTIGTVELEVEFAISCEWWISSDNRKIVNRRGRPRG